MIDLVADAPRTIKEAIPYYFNGGKQISSAYEIARSREVFHRLEGTLPVSFYLSVLGWAEEIINRAYGKLRIISDNKVDGFLEFGRNIEDQLIKGSDVKIISLNESPDYLHKLKEVYENFDFQTGVLRDPRDRDPQDPRDFWGFIIGTHNILELKTGYREMRKKNGLRVDAVVYFKDLLQGSFDFRFDRIWEALKVEGRRVFK